MPKQNNESWEEEAREVLGNLVDRAFEVANEAQKSNGLYNPPLSLLPDFEGAIGELKTIFLSEITKAKEESRQQTLEEIRKLLAKNTDPDFGTVNFDGFATDVIKLITK
jgi:hypothetical protein